MAFIRDPEAARTELRQIRAAISCALVLEQEGFCIDKRESSRRCQKYRSTDGRIVIVSHEGRGWWDPHDTVAKGDVLALLQHLQPGLTFGQVRRKLRPLIGMAPREIPFPRRSRASAAHSVATRWGKMPAVARGSPAWCYLTEARALPSEIVQAAIEQDVVREGRCGTACFAHRDAGGILTCFEMRGPRFRGCPEGSTKTLFRFGGAGDTPVRRVIVTEAAIDALSVASLDLTREGTLYVSTAGGVGPEGIRSLTALLAALPDAQMLVAVDRGTGGERLTATLSTLAEEAGVTRARILPFDGHKDWNAVLQNRRAEGEKRPAA